MTVPVYSLMRDIRSRLNLAAVIAEHMPLATKIEGSVFAGVCPMCDDAAPGHFVVEIWDDGLRSRYRCERCFCCGNVIGFTMRILNVGFREALMQLCEKADIPYIEIEEGQQESPAITIEAFRRLAGHPEAGPHTEEH